MDLSGIMTEVITLCRETGALIQKHALKLSKEDIETKSRNNFVTSIDKAAEVYLVEALKKIIPDAGFHTEEGTVAREDSELMWIIDPIDGTTNFIHRLPCYSISIALSHKAEIVLGCVYEINRDECFYSYMGAPVFLNEEEVRISKCATVNDALLATGFPYQFFDQIEHYIGAFRELMKESRGLRRWGSAAVDLAFVACGRFDGFFEYGLSPWDVAAGSFLVQQAGGKCTDFGGGPNFISGMEMIAGTPGVCDGLQKIVGKHFQGYDPIK